MRTYTSAHLSLTYRIPYQHCLRPMDGASLARRHCFQNDSRRSPPARILIASIRPRASGHDPYWNSRPPDCLADAPLSPSSAVSREISVSTKCWVRCLGSTGFRCMFDGFIIRNLRVFSLEYGNLYGRFSLSAQFVTTYWYWPHVSFQLRSSLIGGDKSMKIALL
jgi:hypothetical protein